MDKTWPRLKSPLHIYSPMPREPIYTLIQSNFELVTLRFSDSLDLVTPWPGPDEKSNKSVQLVTPCIDLKFDLVTV